MKRTRRSFLGTAAVAGAGIGIAGCLGSDVEPPEPPVAGDADADVTVTVYEDFSCSHCRDFKLQTLPGLQEQFIGPGRIRFEQRNFPLPVNDWSWPVACAARAVYEMEGDQAFWEFSAEIYEHFPDYSYDVIENVAADLGLDGTAVRQAAENEEYRDVVEADHSYGSANGVSGTPTVFIDGEMASGNIFDEIADALE